MVGDTDPVSFVIGAQVRMHADLVSPRHFPADRTNSEQGQQIKHLRALIPWTYPQWGMR
jgi:hypothetical protein